MCSVAQLCPMLCNPMHCSPPGSCDHEIFQARILEWLAISYSRVSSHPRGQTGVYCIFCPAGRFFTAEPLGKPLAVSISSVQFSSVLSLICVRLCDPMNCSTPGLPVHHQLQEFTQIHVHRVSDTIQPSNPL